TTTVISSSVKIPRYATWLIRGTAFTTLPPMVLQYCRHRKCRPSYTDRSGMRLQTSRLALFLLGRARRGTGDFAAFDRRFWLLPVARRALLVRRGVAVIAFAVVGVLAVIVVASPVGLDLVENGADDAGAGAGQQLHGLLDRALA